MVLGPPVSTWDLVRAELKDHFEIETLQLISVGTNPKILFYDDAAIVRDFSMKQIEQGKDVVVITHSYSAIPVGDAVKGYRGARGRRRANPAESRHKSTSPPWKGSKSGKLD